MSLIPRNSLFDFERFFDDAWAPFQNAPSRVGAFSPRVDVRDKGTKYEISAELPGVDKQDIHINLQAGVLTIEAETRQEDQEEKDGKLIRQERRYGKFVRSFDLGNQVHEGDIRATFENGVLKLEAPKTDTTQTAAKRIEIN